MRAFAEINEKGTRVEVHFPYDPAAVKAIKEDVPGRQFVPPEKGGPFWTIPLDMPTMKALRNAFGEGLTYGDALRSWGIQEKRRQRELRTLAVSDDAELELLPEVLPQVHAIINGEAIPDDALPEWLPVDHPYREKRDPRPYQRADIAMMAKSSVLNGNQPGTGKTIEYIGACGESGLLEGPHLIFAPVTSHEDTWVTELLCADVPGTVYYGDNPAERKDAIEEAVADAASGETVWLILGYDSARLAKAKLDPNGMNIDPRPVVKRDHKGNEYVLQGDWQKPLFDLKWNTICIDESHKTGLPNHLSLFALGASLLEAERKFSMSGTPMGGKALRLWGHFHWLYPKEYGSKWRWAGLWLDIEDNGYGKTIGGLKAGMDEDFYTAHAHHMVRREKRDALPGLPPKVIKEVICPMTPKQKKQYKKFEKDAEIRIEEERLSARNVLTEYTRLKVFANAACELRITGEGEKRKVTPIPTTDSGKLPKLLEKLDEHGVRKTDPEPRARAIVGSESVAMVETTALFLREHGIEALVLHGGISKKGERKELLRRFRSDDEAPIVLVMTIDTGGVSLNLEQANSMHALDEKWNPDDMEQFEDRGDRGSRKTPLVCYYYRTKDTIQEYIHEVSSDKAVTNKNIMDVRRKMHKEKKNG